MLWTVGALLLSPAAFATADTGDTGDWVETGDTGAPDPGDTDTGDTDTEAQDTGEEVDTDTPAPSASTLASELGGFRCSQAGTLASLSPAAFVLFAVLGRRRERS